MFNGNFFFFCKLFSFFKAFHLHWVKNLYTLDMHMWSTRWKLSSAVSFLSWCAYCMLILDNFKITYALYKDLTKLCLNILIFWLSTLSKTNTRIIFLSFLPLYILMHLGNVKTLTIKVLIRKKKKTVKFLDLCKNVYLATKKKSISFWCWQII